MCVPLGMRREEEREGGRKGGRKEREVMMVGIMCKIREDILVKLSGR